jgi:hypothetical protein
VAISLPPELQELPTAVASSPPPPTPPPTQPGPPQRSSPPTSAPTCRPRSRPPWPPATPSSDRTGTWTRPPSPGPSTTTSAPAPPNHHPARSPARSASPSATRTRPCLWHRAHHRSGRDRDHPPGQPAPVAMRRTRAPGVYDPGEALPWPDQGAARPARPDPRPWSQIWSHLPAFQGVRGQPSGRVVPRGGHLRAMVNPGPQTWSVLGNPREFESRILNWL